MSRREGPGWRPGGQSVAGWGDSPVTASYQLPGPFVKSTKRARIGRRGNMSDKGRERTMWGGRCSAGVRMAGRNRDGEGLTCPRQLHSSFLVSPLHLRAGRVSSGNDLGQTGPGRGGAGQGGAEQDGLKQKARDTCVPACLLAMASRAMFVDQLTDACISLSSWMNST